MTPDMERASFLQHIRDNPDDEAVRAVYADWLEEHDMPEEADLQRNWRESREWLCRLAVSFCGTGGEDGSEDYYGPYREITYADLIQTGHDYIDKGDYFIQIGSDNARDMMSILDTRCLFWRHWSVMTARSLDEMKAEDKEFVAQWSKGIPNPFSCSC